MELSYGMYVERLECVIRCEVNDCLWRKQLIEAARTRLVEGKVVFGFRSGLFFKEGKGSRLYNILGLLLVADRLKAGDEELREKFRVVVETAESLMLTKSDLNLPMDIWMEAMLELDRLRRPAYNPYAEFLRRHPPSRRRKDIITKLDFLSEEPMPKFDVCTQTFDLGMSDGEVHELLTVLQSGKIPWWFMEEFPMLRYDENLDVQVQYFRLWLLKSELPLHVGTDLTYAHLRDSSAALPEPVLGHVLSSFDISLKQDTIMRHLGMLQNKAAGLYEGKLFHPRPCDFSENYFGRRRCYANVGYPHFTCRDTSLEDYVASDEACDETMDVLLAEFKAFETPDMATFITKRMFSVVEPGNPTGMAKSTTNAKGGQTKKGAAIPVDEQLIGKVDAEAEGGPSRYPSWRNNPIFVKEIWF